MCLEKAFETSIEVNKSKRAERRNNFVKEATKKKRKKGYQAI